MASYDLHRKAASIVRDAGGQLVGRTRLQKVTYLSQLAGFANEFPFEYRHYGPYSQDLGDAIDIAVGFRLVSEEERSTDWGGRYSIYRSGQHMLEDVPLDEGRSHFIAAAQMIDAIELELAATAAFLYAEEGVGRDDGNDPWKETRRRKPEKADGGRLARAKKAYRRLSQLETPSRLPPIV